MSASGAFGWMVHLEGSNVDFLVPVMFAAVPTVQVGRREQASEFEGEDLVGWEDGTCCIVWDDAHCRVNGCN